MKLFLSSVLIILTLTLASCSLGRTDTATPSPMTHNDSDGHGDHSMENMNMSSDDAMRAHCQTMPAMAGCEKYATGASVDPHDDHASGEEHDMSAMVMGDPKEYTVSFLNAWTANTDLPVEFRIERSGQVVTSYDIAHEKKLHFIVVRSDLSDFQHIHPTFDEAKKTWSIDMKLPTEGKYRLFADFVETGKSNVVVPTDIVTTGGENAPNTVLTPSTKRVVDLGNGYRAEMVLPSEVNVGTPLTYSIRLTKDLAPVGELENYLGAKGHSVVLRQGTLDFIHTHAASSAANSVNFQTSFTQTGTYAIFSQIQHAGNVLTVPYVVTVNEAHDTEGGHAHS